MSGGVGSASGQEHSASESIRLSGRYRILRHLAAGGMAEVYLAQDERLGRQVAVKVLPSSLARDPSFVERFRREAKSAAGLNHPNIVSVYDFGEDDGSYFIVMEYVPGDTLKDVIAREHALAPARALEIAADVAAALGAAHRRGIVHRDVKPANVLIDDGSVKVTDFGIALASGEGREAITNPGAVVGTASYLSPEQAKGEELDGRSDLYSLGMVLYEMLTGRPPFAGGTALAVAVNQMHETPPPPSSVNPAVSPALDDLVARAMARDPADRVPTAAELRSELLALIRDAPDEAPDLVAAGAGATTTALAATTATAATATTALPATAAARTGARAPAGPRGPSHNGAGPDDHRRSIYRRRRIAVLACIGLVLAATGALIGFALLHGKGGNNGPKTTGTAQTATVPSLVGLTVDEARAALDKVGLDAKVTDRADPGPVDRVIDQNPTAGTVVDAGSSVTIFVPTPPESTTAPPTTRTTRPTTTSTTRPPTTTATTAPTTTATTAPTTTATTAPTTTAPTTTAP